MSGAVGGWGILVVQGVSVRFGGIVAVDDVSLSVGDGEVVGLIGPNGAGKTTLIEAISGFTPATGSVTLDGKVLTGLSPQARIGQGLARSFQDARLFGGLTVRESLLLAQQHQLPSSAVGALIGTPRARRAERQRRDQTEVLLAQFGLAKYAQLTIAELSTGMRRIVELAAAISLRPKVLLLDEPSAGLAQREVEQLPEVLTDIQAQTGAAMVIVEHDVPFLTAVVSRMIAMQSGRIIADGTPAEVCADPEVVRAYLGGDASAIARSGT